MNWLAIFVLAQTADAAAAAPPPPPPSFWTTFKDSTFLWLVLFIFLTSLVTVIIRLRKRDKCLALIRNYRVTYLTVAGSAIWGKLLVYSQGMELVFDVPYRTRRGLLKASAMLYDPDIAGSLAILRPVGGLTERQHQLRQKQIRRSFRPGIIRRSVRWVRNLFNTLRDAFLKAFSSSLSQATKAMPTSTVLTSQKGSIDQIGQTILGEFGNAYEPMLERHVGRPVVLQLNAPADPTKLPIELPGYLVDYTDRYIAVFNVDHEPKERLDLELTENYESPGVKIALDPQNVTITCTGSDVLVVDSMTNGGQERRLELALTRGTFVQLPRIDESAVQLKLELTQHIDIVCPRTQGKVLFGADELDAPGEIFIRRIGKGVTLQGKRT